jgi:acyl carrier protein phosphodiesterase
MERDNWLFSYRTIEGITQALNGLSRRTKYESNMEQGGLVLQENYDQLEEQFYAFMPDLQHHVSGLNPHFQSF